MVKMSRCRSYWAVWNKDNNETVDKGNFAHFVNNKDMNNGHWVAFNAR